MTNVNYCLLSSVNDHIPLIERLIAAKCNFTLYVFSEKDLLKIGELFSSRIEIKVVPLVNVASKKNWEVICSYVDVIAKQKGFFYRARFKEKESNNVYKRFLSLSSLRYEVARMLALDGYVVSNKIDDMVVCSRYIDSKIQEFIPGEAYSFSLCMVGRRRLTNKVMTYWVNKVHQARSLVLKKLMSLRKPSKFVSQVVRGLGQKKSRKTSLLNNMRDENNTYLKNESSRNENVELNVYFYDLRPNYLVSKLAYLLPVMNKFLEKGKKVRLIVEGGAVSQEIKNEIEMVCKNCLSERSLFSCVYSSRRSLKNIRWIGVISLTMSKWSDLAITKQYVLSMSAFFENLVLKYPAKSWVGLIDSYQISMIKEAVKKNQLPSTVGAIQYGTPDYTQLAYRYFQPDILFANDQPSSAIYNALSIRSRCIETGSLEAESLLKGLSREEGARTVVVFFDQPILQREDFDQALVDSTYQFLLRISKFNNIDVLIKCHPRKPKDSLPSALQESSVCFLEGENLGQIFMRSTFSISFTSSLLDVAAYAGSLPISIGGDRYYSEGQKKSLELAGGIISEDFKQLEEIISLSAASVEYKRKLAHKTKKIHSNYCSQFKPSEIIYKTLEEE